MAGLQNSVTADLDISKITEKERRRASSFYTTVELSESRSLLTATSLRPGFGERPPPEREIVASCF